MNTPISNDDVDSIFFANLTPEEIARCVVYVARMLISAGDRLEFPRTSIDVPWPAFIAFVDREPTANWSHSCRYILLNSQTGEIKSFESQFPPFQPNQKMEWGVLYKAPSVPSGAVMC